MLLTTLMLGTVVLHLGVGFAIALRGRLILAALVSVSIIAVPLVVVRLFGSPQDAEAFLALVATPLGAISLLVGLAGAVWALVRRRGQPT